MNRMSVMGIQMRLNLKKNMLNILKRLLSFRESSEVSKSGKIWLYYFKLNL